MRKPSFLSALALAGTVLGTLAWLAAWGMAPTPVAAATPIPPVPAYADLPLPDNQSIGFSPTGELSWLGQRPVEPAPKGVPPGCWAWELVTARWHPATGRTAQAPLKPGVSGHVYSQLVLPAGVLALTQTGCQEGKERWRFVLLPRGGGPALLAETSEAIDIFQTGLLALGDSRAALVTREKDNRHIKVLTVQRTGDRLEIAAMPTLPVAYRSDFASAVAGQDQVMILGGSNGNYRGCSPCRAETHVLDLKARTWRNGPPMLEARSELAASSLPDGSILVTGGWTKAAEWGSGGSRTAERWNPATHRFEALPPMPNGTTRHRHVWWDAPWGRTLLVVPGLAGAAQSLDMATWSWRTVGEWGSGSEEGGCGFYPFVLEGHAYAWLVNRTEGHYSSKSCGEQKYADLTLLRPPSEAAPAPLAPPESALITYRHGAAFVPAAGKAPALVIGGARHAGMNTFVISSAVEAMDQDGRATTLPSLRTARQGAKAFRVAGGLLVVGGSGPDSPYGGVREPKPLKAEWLAPPGAGRAPWQWQEVGGNSPSPSAAVAQLRDGSLLALEPDGELRQLVLAMQGTQPAFESRTWPALSRERRNGDGGDGGDGASAMRIQELDDGRIVVAGGWVRSERIARYSAQALQAGQPDDYVGIGDFLPWRRYEIFDPATRRWVRSAPAKAAGGRAIVLRSGRVIKVAPTPQAAQASEPQRFVLEASDPAGATWAPLANKGSRLQINDRYALFTMDDELLASGEIAGVNTGGGPGGVEWLNPATGTWEMLWQAGPNENWRLHQGRIVRRTVTGSNGQAKTLLIPVGGL